MKYVKFYEIAIEDTDEMIEKWGKYLEESKKTPEQYPTYIFPPHGLGDASTLKGISIMEADEQQLINYMIALSPPLKAKFVPLFDSTKFIETYMKTKK